MRETSPTHPRYRRCTAHACSAAWPFAYRLLISSPHLPLYYIELCVQHRAICPMSRAGIRLETAPLEDRRANDGTAPPQPYPLLSCRRQSDIYTNRNQVAWLLWNAIRQNVVTPHVVRRDHQPLLNSNVFRTPTMCTAALQPLVPPHLLAHVTAWALPPCITDPSLSRRGPFLTVLRITNAVNIIPDGSLGFCSRYFAEGR